MALSFPRELYVEMWLGKWVDITGAVREEPGITMSPGRGNEQGRVTPNLISMTLKNGTDLPAPFAAGDFTPGNPKGQYFGKLGRNTPIRGGVKVVRDTFTRTVSNGWGSADTGEAYSTVGGSAADYAVSGGVGTHTIAAANESRRTFFATPNNLRDYEIRVDLPALSAQSGATVSQSVILRGQTSPLSYVAIDCQITSAGGVELAIRTVGPNDYLVGAISVGTLVGGHAWTLAGQVEGSTFRGKLWDKTAGDEPYDWQVEAHSDDMPASGWAGVVSVSGNNAASKTYTYDNLTIRIPRFSGVTADLRPRWDGTHKHKWVEVEASGILRRLGQGKPPTSSAIERFVVNHATQPIAYWPLDDDELSNAGRVAAGLGAEAISNFISTTGPTVNFTPGRSFGNGRLATWLKPGLSIDHGSFLRCALLTPYSGSWTMHCALAFNGRYADSIDEDALTVGNLTTGFWSIFFRSFNQEINVTKPGGGSVATVSVAIYDDAVHHIGFRATQNGADVDWRLIIDGAVASSGTAAALTNPEIVRAVFQQSSTGDDSRSRSVGHVVLYSGNGPATADVYDAIVGHPGEVAGRRAERICDKDGIAFEHVGSLDDTAAMGPQPAASTLDILRDCETADRGTLYEPRSVVGLAYRTLGSLYNQTQLVTLDYSAGQVSAPLHPIDDDQQTRNQITAKRRDGGQAQVIQESGPLNVNDPDADPDGVGVYDDEVTVNVESDDQLPYIAGHLLRLGTADEDRYPKVRVNLATSSIDTSTAQELSVLAVNIDDRFAIANLTDADIYASIDQLARGYTELLSGQRHEITFNTAPAAPYTAFVLETDRLDSNTSTLSVGVNTSATSLSVATTQEGVAPLTLWTTDAADFPFNIEVGGEVMTVTAISGASSPQTFTVARNANNLPGGKSHSAGAQVHLATDAALALQG